MAGVGGMLGEAFYDIFSCEYQVKATDKDVNSDWLEFLDFRDYNSYRNDVLSFNPDYLFHIGAYTDLEYCERNVEDAYITNSCSVENAVLIANELNIPLLYISTAGIYDGTKDLYDDYDLPNPLGVYARSKYVAERYVVENANKYFICRAGWMMGGGPVKDKKFIGKLMNQIKGGTKILHIVDDKDGTPTYTVDFAKNTKELIQSGRYGLYNMVCGGQTSRLEVAKELVSILGLDSEVSVLPVNSSHFSDLYYAPRPPNERLVNFKLNLVNLNVMRDWKICLKEYIDSRYKDFL